MFRERWTRALVAVLLAAALAVPGVALAVTDEDLEAESTPNLLYLCAVSAEDSRYKEALALLKNDTAALAQAKSRVNPDATWKKVEPGPGA